MVRFAETLGTNVREGDWVARWGGDEFAVAVWNAGKEETWVERVLEHVAQDLRENPVVLPSGEEVFLTFSGGVRRWETGDRVQGMFSRAGEALYRAKGEGGTVRHAD